ncbi:MAG TPA: GPP34 family phosphoprotein, partial [Mycobacterium sp.]|nr:GPP34 family phosphoprotein [Mycobacterium sp.]
MAQIAEDLFLLLLDNASAQPSLDRVRRERVLSA